MTSPQIIEVVVSPDGQSRVETKGFAGASCQQASCLLEQALGQRSSEQLTTEFYTEATQQQQLHERH